MSSTLPHGSPTPPTLLTTDERELGKAGVIVVVDPERADELGAFRETALSLEDALEAAVEE